MDKKNAKAVINSVCGAWKLGYRRAVLRAVGLLEGEGASREIQDSQAFYEFSFVENRPALRFSQFKVLDCVSGPASSAVRENFRLIRKAIAFLKSEGLGFSAGALPGLGELLYEGCACGFGADFSKAGASVKVYFAPARIVGQASPGRGSAFPKGFLKSVARVFGLDTAWLDPDKAAFVGINLGSDGGVSMKYYEMRQVSLPQLGKLEILAGASAARRRAIERCFSLNHGAGAKTIYFTERSGGGTKLNVTVSPGPDPEETSAQALRSLSGASPFFGEVAGLGLPAGTRPSIVTLEKDHLGAYFK